MTIRVILADDQPLIRAGLRRLIDQTPDIDVAGEAGTGAEAVQLARDTSPDVVVMDIRMPGMDGIEATQIITDSGRGGSAAGTGYGITGMRERATLLGGDFSAGPRPGGGFRVTARLPLPAPASAR